MEIRLASLLRGAQEAEGTTIIIDVFRAFTTAAVAFDRGAEQIVLVAEVEDALALRRRGVGHLCIGEVDGKRPAGFDFGNSPFHYMGENIKGKSIVLTTTNGTQAIEAAKDAYKVVIGSFNLNHAGFNSPASTPCFVRTFAGICIANSQVRFMQRWLL